MPIYLPHVPLFYSSPLSYAFVNFMHPWFNQLIWHNMGLSFWLRQTLRQTSESTESARFVPFVQTLLVVIKKEPEVIEASEY